MSEVNHALQRIARGTGIVFAGTIISMFFGFLSVAVIARVFSRAEYGVFSLALTFLSAAVVVATIGFPNSLPREVAFYREKEHSRIVLFNGFSNCIIDGFSCCSFSGFLICLCCSGVQRKEVEIMKVIASSFSEMYLSNEG